MAFERGRQATPRGSSGRIAATYIDEASRHQYLLGYYPTNTSVDGRFRDVRVTVSRPGVTVLVRGGYYARPETGPLDRKSVATFGRMAAAASDAREIPDLALSATAMSTATAVTIDSMIDLSRVLFQKVGGRNTASIEVWAFCLDRRQKSVGDLRQTVELSYTDERLTELRRSRVPVSLLVPVTGAAQTVKVVAYDFAGDLTGSRNVTVTR